jgi:Tetratricopeptide repeat
METMKSVLGVEHPSTRTSMANLAYTLKDQNHDDEALELVTSCLNLRMKVLGPSHHGIQSVLGTLVAWFSAGGVPGYQGGQSDNHMPGAWVD